MILDSDQHITKTITNVELTLDIIKCLGWYTESDKLGFKNEWTFFNKDFPNSHIDYVCESGRFVFVYISKRYGCLKRVVVDTYNELMVRLDDY